MGINDPTPTALAHRDAADTLCRYRHPRHAFRHAKRVASSYRLGSPERRHWLAVAAIINPA